MSSTPAQNSRYPRPLKAIRTFQQQSPPELSPPIHSMSDSHSEPTSSRTGGDCLTPNHTIDPFSNVQYSTPDLSSNIMEDKRSNSLDSLSDNSLTVASVGPEDVHSHKRSNSLTNSHQLPPTASYSRFSVEDLNQEVSSALEGKSLSFEFSHPDGHIAPVNDLVKGGVTHISVTTPIHSSPPFCSYGDDLSSSVSSLHLHCSSHSSALLYPSSPKSSFDHRPPDWAERCTSTHNTMFYSTPRAPDRSKANIVFNGSVFSPLLPSSHSIETLTIS